MLSMKQLLILACVSGWLAGCAANKVEIAGPTSARPQPQIVAPVASGGIYQAASFRPLFEDRRARFVGDTLVMIINEKTSASNQTSNSNSRSASADVGVPKIPLLPSSLLAKTSVSASASSKAEDKDSAKNDNVFTGSITVTVMQVLANGNLLVSGEKQVGVNGETDTLRFSGVVNPATIQTGNTVASMQVADARIETVSRSNIDGAKVAGFLARFFMSFIPFR
jgi:flagellar L-ring protein precursor FlgH